MGKTEEKTAKRISLIKIPMNTYFFSFVLLLWLLQFMLAMDSFMVDLCHAIPFLYSQSHSNKLSKCVSIGKKFSFVYSKVCWILITYFRFSVSQRETAAFTFQCEYEKKIERNSNSIWPPVASFSYLATIEFTLFLFLLLLYCIAATLLMWVCFVGFVLLPTALPPRTQHWSLYSLTKMPEKSPMIINIHRCCKCYFRPLSLSLFSSVNFLFGRCQCQSTFNSVVVPFLLPFDSFIEKIL